MHFAMYWYSKFTKKSTIGEVLNMNIETARFLWNRHAPARLPASQGESIEEACMVHGTNADELVAKLKRFSGRISRVSKKIRAGIVCRLCFFGVLHGKYDLTPRLACMAAWCRKMLDWRISERITQAADLTAAGWAYCIGYRLGYPFRTAGTCGAQCERA